MTRYDVTTRSKQGQWVNEVEGAPELSRSFRSREEAVQEGREFAAARDSRHVVEPSEPTGTITDGGDVADGIAVVDDGAATDGDSES